MAEPPDIRASDADRERAADLLRRHCSEGRLTLDELQDRLGEVYAARTVGQLHGLEGPLRELPALAPLPPAHVQQVTTRVPIAHLGHGFPEHLAVYLAVNAFLIVVWAFTGFGYFWPIFPIGGWGIGLAAHYASVRQRPPLRPR